MSNKFEPELLLPELQLETVKITPNKLDTLIKQYEDLNHKLDKLIEYKKNGNSK